MKGFISPVVLIITFFVAFSDPRDSIFKLEWDVMPNNTLILIMNNNKDISIKLDEIFSKKMLRRSMLIAVCVKSKKLINSCHQLLIDTTAPNTAKFLNFLKLPKRPSIDLFKAPKHLPRPSAASLVDHHPIRTH